MVRSAVVGLVLALGLTACEEAPATLPTDLEPVAAVVPGGADNAGGHRHGPVLNVDGVEYYLAGAPDGEGGAFDIPGHHWVVAGNGQFAGKHYNTGPFGASQWWSTDAPDGELLYVVHGVIDEWTPEKAATYASRGYVHYHELITVDDGALHPNKVLWLRHTARTDFTLDGGPAPQFSHEVAPGVDLEFIPNGLTPYSP